MIGLADMAWKLGYSRAIGYMPAWQSAGVGPSFERHECDKNTPVSNEYYKIIDKLQHNMELANTIDLLFPEPVPVCYVIRA